MQNNPSMLVDVLQSLGLIIVTLIGLDLLLSGGKATKFHLTKVGLKMIGKALMTVLSFASQLTEQFGRWVVTQLRASPYAGWHWLWRGPAFGIGYACQAAGQLVAGLAGAVLTHLRAKPAAHGHHGGHNPHP